MKNLVFITRNSRNLRKIIDNNNSYQIKLNELTSHEIAVVVSKIKLPFQDRNIIMVRKILFPVYKQLHVTSFDDPKELINVMQSLSNFDERLSIINDLISLRAKVWEKFQTNIEEHAKRIKYSLNDVNKQEEVLILGLSECFKDDTKQSPDRIIINFLKQQKMNTIK